MWTRYFITRGNFVNGLIDENDIGPSYYDEAVMPFYKALKVYPAPMELVTIYEKTIPGPVFQTIVSILTIEVRIFLGL